MKQKKLFIRSVASILVLTFSYSQLVWAADVRQMLLDAKAFFEEQEALKPHGMTSSDLQASQTSQQAAVNQQQALQDLQNNNFSLTTQNGDILKYVGDKLDSVARPDGTKLANVTTDLNGNILNADLQLSDGSVQIFQNGQVVGYQTPDGSQAIYQNGVIQKVIDKNGAETLYSFVKDSFGNVTETTLDNPSYTTKYDANNKIKEATRKSDNQKIYYTNGMIQKIVSADGSQTLFNGAIVNGDTVVTPQGSASNVFVDAAGNKFNFTAGTVASIVLTDGSTLDNITWDANNKIDSANLTQTDGARFIYQLKKLTRSYDILGIVTNYTYTPTTILAATAGNTYEYLLDKTPTKFTALDGTVTTYLTSGAYKGLKDTETSLTGTKYVYEYQGSGPAITAQRREVQSTAYNIFTLDGQAYNLQGGNPAFRTTIQFANDNSVEPAVVLTAVNSAATKNLKLNLVSGAGSTYTFNNITTSLGVTLNKATDYKVEIKWETGRIGVYVYAASSTKPATPTVSIADRAWDPKFKAVSTNVKTTLDTTSSGAYNQNATVWEKNYPTLPNNPVMRFEFRPTSAGYKTMLIRAKNWTPAGVVRTYDFNYGSNGVWTFSRTDGSTLFASSTLAQSYAANTDYVAEVRVENSKMNLYVYAKGQPRPSAATASFDSLNFSSFEVYTTNVTGQATEYKNLTAPTAQSATSAPLTARLDTVNASSVIKPAAPATVNATDFGSITYDTLSNLKQVIFKDGSKLIFDKGVLKQSLDAAGKQTDFNFVQSGLSNIVGTSIAQSTLTSTYSADGKLANIKINDMTVHYKADGATVEWIEKTDGTELWNLTFNTAGSLTDALIVSPDGEERTYVAGKLAQLRRPDQSQLFYANSQVTKMITPEKLTYDFNYTTPGVVQAVLDTTAVPAPDALTPIKMEYDTNFNLTKVTRQNQEVINYLNNQVDQISAPSSAAKVFAYQKDTSGNILSYTVTQSNVVTTYDANNQPTSATINPDANNPNVLNVSYQYGKIRQVKKNGAVTFNYSYSFDAAGTEMTLVDDLEENAQKIYTGGNLISSLDKANSVLSSYLYSNNQISQVKVTRFGHELHTYDYNYVGTDTIVKDEQGVIRTYDVNKKLTYLEKDGQKFAYTYTTQTVTIPGPSTTQETQLPTSLYQTSARSLLSWNNGQAWFSYEQPYGKDYLQTHWAGQWVEYSANMSQTGDLKIALEASDSDTLPTGYTNFQLELSVDGVLKGTMSVPAGANNNWLAGALTLTGLSQGNHTVRLKFANFVSDATGQTDFKFRNISFKQVTTTTTSTTSQKDIVSENLIEKKLADGSLAHYAQGVVTQIDRPDGKILKSFVRDASGQVTEMKLFSDSQDTIGTKLYFSNGQISKATLATGQDLVYSYDKDANGNILTTWVTKGAATLKFDANEKLLGLKISGAMDPGQLMQGVTNIYTGGSNGSMSIDGDPSTAQSGTFDWGAGGKSVYLTSEHDLPAANTVTGFTFLMGASTNAQSIGGQRLDSSSSIFLETKDATTGLWTVVPGSYVSQSISNNGDGRSFVTSVGAPGTGLAALAINIPNVIAVRAQARAEGTPTFYRDVSKGKAFIYELQYSLADESIMSFGSTTNGAGQTTGYTLSGFKGSLGFDVAGNVTQANTNYSAIQQELSGVIQNYTKTPFKDLDITSVQSALDATDSIISQEYASDGTLETQTKADGTVTLFENNKPSQVLDSTGQILIQYNYDASGNPTRVYLKNARDTLPDEVIKARLTIEQNRAQALRDLASQKNLAYQSIQTTYQNQRAALNAQLASLQSQFDDVSNTSAKGKSAKNARGDALNTIGHAMDDTRVALSASYSNEADTYAALDGQIKTLSDRIEADSQSAFTQLSTQEANLKKEILRQEVSPIVYDYYRRILGRDPDTAEYNYWIGLIDYSSGATLSESKTTAGQNLTTALNSYINALPELADRQAYVNTIKTAVTSQINSYLAMTQAQKEAFAATLGLAPQDLIPLSSADGTKISTWLSSRSLHFGQSAFLALESLLDQKGKTYVRTDLAKQAILIDILTGVISPLDDGDLVISMFALNKVAESNGVILQGANLGWADLQKIYQANPNAKVIAHVRDNHYVVVTGITNTTITYMDPGKGKDKQNEVITLGKAEFLKGWKGNVTAESAFINPVIAAQASQPNPSARALSKDETQKIRGAFFFLFIPAIIGALASIGGAVASVVAGIGTILASVGAIVGSVLSGVGQILSGFGGVLSGIGSSLFQGISFAASSLYSAVGNVGTFLSQNIFGSIAKAGFGNTLFQTAVKTGFSVATSKGLQALGVNPVISNLASAFVTGGITGGFNAGFTAQNFIQSGMKTLAFQGGQTVLQNAGIDTTLSQALLTMASPFVDGVQTGNIGGATVKIIQDLPKNLSNYGLAKAGETLGLTPTIAFAAAMPLAQTLSDGLKNGNLTGQSLIQSVQSSLTQGAVTYGVEFAGQSSPILGSLLSQDIVKNIEAALGRDGLFGSVFNILQRSVLNLVNVVGGAVQSAFQGISNFAGEIQQKGLAGALEANRDALLNRTTQEAILAKGGVQNLLNATPKTSITLQNGQAVQEVRISNAASLYFDNSGNFIGKKEDGVTQIGTYYKDSATGKVALESGAVYADVQGDLKMTATVNDGQATSIKIDGPSTPLVAINPEQQNAPIRIEGPQNSETIPSFWSSALNVTALGLWLMFGPGTAKEAKVTINATPATISGLTNIALLNGIRLIDNIEKGQIVLPAEAPDYFKSGQPYRNKLNSLGVSDSLIKTVPLFESILGILDVVFDGALVIKIREYFKQIAELQQGQQFVPVAYSGSGRPTLTALEDPEDNGYSVRTAILVGAPVSEEDTQISSPTLDRIINVYGSEDDFLTTGFAPEALGIRKIFTSSTRNFETINIELKNIEHIQYFYENSDNPTPAQRKASDFIAHLTQAALNPSTLESFLQDFTNGSQSASSVFIDGLEQKVRTYIVDVASVVGL